MSALPDPWRDRLSDPWFVLPIAVLVGAVVALALAIALEPSPSTIERSVIATGVTPAASPAPAADAAARDRDTLRLGDIYRIAHASFAYYNDHGSYPVTSGVQTLCVDRNVDSGCRFESYLEQIPFDPRGDPAVNGYWYQSDGKRYTLYLSMESLNEPMSGSCPSSIPKELANVPHLYCVNMGPPKP